MPKYTQEMIETRTVRVEYTVEAASAEEAADKLAIGETESESEMENSLEVVSRDPYGPMTVIDEPWRVMVGGCDICGYHTKADAEYHVAKERARKCPAYVEHKQ